MQNGLWTGKKPPFVKVGVIRNTNFTKDCTLDDSNIFFTDVEEKAYKKRKLLKGDIIIEKSGGSEKQPVGRPILFDLDGEYSFSNFTSVLRLNTNELTPSFLHKALVGLYFQGKTRPLQSKTTGIHNLDFNKFLQFSIPVPPLSIQQRIVAELDCISGILEKKRQQLKELDNLAQAIFYDMFGDPVENEKGWEVNSLNRIALLKNGLNFGRVDEGIKVKILGVSDFQENKKISSKEIGYTIVSKEVEDNFYLKDNDLVFVRSNGSKSLIGRCVLINTFGEKVSFSGFCIRCRIISDKVIPQFLLSLMQEPKVKVQLTCGGRGCNIQNINQENLGKQPVILPPLSLQQSFAAKIEAIEKQKERISQSIKEVQTLFDSRMEVYFG